MSTTRPLRADAERNRQRILAAAAELFAERGLDVSLDDIAAAAGVGVGTVYRRFPDKDALIDALFEAKIDRVVALADDALELEDPWEGLRDLHARHVPHAGGGPRPQGRAPVARPRARAHGRRARADRAARASAVRASEGGGRRAGGPRPVRRADAAPRVGPIADITRDVAPDYWERILTILIDGISAQGAATPMPVQPLDREAFTEAMASPRRRR